MVKSYFLIMGVDDKVKTGYKDNPYHWKNRIMLAIFYRMGAVEKNGTRNYDFLRIFDPKTSD